MSKLPDVRGRITYISSHAKQENLYAVYETADRQHSIPHSVSPTHIRKNVPNGKKSTERKPPLNPKPYTERYRDIGKRLTGRMPTNHTEAEIKGRDKSPLVCNFFQL